MSGPSPVRLMRSHRVELAEIEMMRPSEDVWRLLPLPGAVVTWLVTGSGVAERIALGGRIRRGS
jgi:hypothetical protein